MTAHPEAFCLMQYDADDGTETEVIWNSRDGVTPFVVTLRSGKPATHSRWNEDLRCSESMARGLGVRWFTEHTEETARAAAVEYVEQYWNNGDYPMSRLFNDQASAVDRWTGDWIGGPTLIESPGQIQREPVVSKFGGR